MSNQTEAWPSTTPQPPSGAPSQPPVGGTSQPPYGAQPPSGGTAEQAKEQAARVAQSAKESAGDVASTAGEQARNVASEAAAQARDLIGEARSQAQHQAGQQQQKAAEGLRALAGELRSMAQAGSQSGLASEVVRQASTRAESAADWLGAREPGQLLDEVRSFARRKPGVFLFAAAAAGVAAGRLTRGVTAASSSQQERTGGRHVATGVPQTTTEPAGSATVGTGAATSPGSSDTAVLPPATLTGATAPGAIGEPGGYDEPGRAASGERNPRTGPLTVPEEPLSGFADDPGDGRGRP